MGLDEFPRENLLTTKDSKEQEETEGYTKAHSLEIYNNQWINHIKENNERKQEKLNEGEYKPLKWTTKNERYEIKKTYTRRRTIWHRKRNKETEERKKIWEWSIDPRVIVLISI